MEPLHSAFLSSFPSFPFSPSRLSSPLLSPFPIHRRRRILAVHSSPRPITINRPQSKTLTLTPLSLAKSSLSLLVFSLTIAFLPFPIHSPALAAPIAVAASPKSRSKSKPTTDHEFSIYTKRLLAAVSALLNKIDEVKAGKGDIKSVKEALKEVKAKRKEIQGEILEVLNSELRELRKEKWELVKRSGEVMEAAAGFSREKERVLKEAGVARSEEVKGLDGVIQEKEREYGELWEKVGEIEDRILRKETMVYSVAIRELGFIERESEVLVERFVRRLRQQGREERYGFLHCFFD